MSSVHTFRRALGAAAPLFIAAACTDAVGPRPESATSAAVSAAQPLAHWMRVPSLPAAYDMVAARGALYAASSDDGVFRSADGVRWERVAAFAPGLDPA